ALAAGAALAAPPAAGSRPAPAAGAVAAPAGTRGAELLHLAGQRPAPPAAAVDLAEPGRGALVLETLGHDLALVDPHLHADPAEGRLRLGEPVVDVGTQGVQGHAALAVLLRARHLRAAQAAAAADLHALGAGADRRRQRALHRPPERHAVLELLGDRLGDQLGVELRALDLGDVHLDVLRRHRVQLTPQRVDLGAGLSDHDAGTGRVDVDRDPLLVLADVDVRQAGVRELAVDVVADLHVLHQRVRELLRRDEPVRLPRVDDADPQAAWVDFVSH